MPETIEFAQLKALVAYWAAGKEESGVAWTVGSIRWKLTTDAEMARSARRARLWKLHPTAGPESKCRPFSKLFDAARTTEDWSIPLHRCSGVVTYNNTPPDEPHSKIFYVTTDLRLMLLEPQFNITEIGFIEPLTPEWEGSNIYRWEM